jgi:peptidoglycan/LPS O-acetylase OafA/YrhL
MPEGRLLGADFVRASACVLVLLHHLAQRMSHDADMGAMEWLRTFVHLGGYGVAAFFVLSGYLLARPFWQALATGQPMPSLGTYTLRRAARILPGFWLALTVTFVLSFTVFGATLDGELILRFLAGALTLADWHWLTFFPVEVNPPLWSISFEVTAYLLLPAAFALIFAIAAWLKHRWLLPLVWVLVLGLALVAHGLFMTFYPIDDARRGWEFGLVGGAKFWMPRYNPFAFFAMFAIGAWAAGLQVMWLKSRSFVFDVIAILAMAWIVERLAARLPLGWDDLYGLGIPYDFPWFVLPLGVFLAVSPSTVLLGRLLDNRAVRYVAMISFGIYIWHYLLLEMVRAFFFPELALWTATEPGRFALGIGLVTALSLAAAHFSYRWLEAPIIRWARNREAPEAPRGLQTEKLSSARLSSG